MANKWDERKKAKEDEYFVKKERELLAKIKLKQEAEAKAAAVKASSMRCPKCGASLKERSFQKIQIDQCTGCDGVLLCGQAKRVPPHGMQHVQTSHPLVSCDDVRGRIPLRMADV